MQVSSTRKSKVNLLPQEIRDQLHALLRSGTMHQKDILEAVNQMIDEAGLGEDAKLSRTGFNRFAKKFEQVGERIRQSREVAEVWTAKLGQAPTSDVGKLLQEFVRTMAFETSMKMMDAADQEDAEPISPKALGQLALVVQRIEAAAMSSIKVEKEIRSAFAAEAATKVEQIVKQAGISAETAIDIKNQILGIA
ncbi:DUF3486 family protein [Shewanella oneidensis MR-1]|uniref:Mu phage small terminase subunit GpD n=1 Tax=Shewanella oneidensis (strain ATCC 700550 / JCM 31522 / CIP 106686 / LMG 19005 / NCIMB 14063 / MR-1) TaxID=211586 RepID=Q8EDR6_SHEON|nr:DUF3486 family protein [Shewanella oneidensis]AAN55705.1 Mu phage small terminase subunit GpD [Shewanella oneidensis MR-1]MDX5995653.1 DUF3486 family protein [Shewanella oneidensis]MEE2026296.1 hypothetical protein [Shewanella oneidensis]QKG97180.1 DUF3486 family protein [Shewanella oneidensis MR-1]